jgi:ketosteroid isomerase-like protein
MPRLLGAVALRTRGPGRDTARAMSQRDQEMIASLRRGYEAFNRGDFDAAMEIVHPKIEFVPPGGQSPLRGEEALRAWMEPDAFEEQEIEPFEFTVKGDKVLVRTVVRAKGAGSGIELDFQVWAVWTLGANGLATRVETYLPHEEAEALQAAGLRE